MDVCVENNWIFRILFCSLNFSAELAYYTPQEVAETTIAAMLKNKKYVSMPSFYQQAFTFVGLVAPPTFIIACDLSLHYYHEWRKCESVFFFKFRLLPLQFQDLIRENFKPNVGPEVNEPAKPRWFWWLVHNFMNAVWVNSSEILGINQSISLEKEWGKKQIAFIYRVNEWIWWHHGNAAMIRNQNKIYQIIVVLLSQELCMTYTICGPVRW